jgi:hypothetical protein
VDGEWSLVISHSLRGWTNDKKRMTEDMLFLQQISLSLLWNYTLEERDRSHRDERDDNGKSGLQLTNFLLILHADRSLRSRTANKSAETDRLVNIGAK